MPRAWHADTEPPHDRMEVRSRGGRGVSPPASAGWVRAPLSESRAHSETHQSSMFHMSDAVPGFLKKFWSRTDLPRVDWR